jgi:hypothetical protein
LLGDEENRTCPRLAPIHIPNLANPSQTSQSDQLNLNNDIVHPMSSNQMSPSTAVRSIFADLLQQCKPNSPPHPKTNKRMRIEGKFGEEITSSNRLNELKQKASKPNPKKRLFESKQTTGTSFATGSGGDPGTTTKRRKLSKQTSEVITLSQATRAIATFRTLSSGNTVSDQNDIHSPLETQQ